MMITSWDAESSTEFTNEILKNLARKHIAECSKTEAVAAVLSALEAEDYASLCSFKLDYSILTPLDSYHLGQALAFYKKRVDLDLGVDRESVGWTKFQNSEEQCRATNEVFRAWSRGGLQFLPAVEAVLFSAQRKIAYVLGDCPKLSDLRIRFGPGSTTQIPKRMACAKVKLSQPPACSYELVPILDEVLAEMPAYTSMVENGTIAGSVEIHPGRLEFVLKNAHEYRVVVVEPWLNQMVQLGIGDRIAKRLRRIGIDTRDQSRNRGMAALGSITGALATLDLSSASDTISLELVKHLLPYEWYDLLASCRTGTVSYKGEELRLQKFSSMGNGFTFPLECLIFWAVTTSVCEKADASTISVYGDDIICPSVYAERVMHMLGCLGFTPNMAKSFWNGPFRESCGGDYYLGIDIRPIFIGGPLTGHDLFRLHNFYVRSGQLDFASAVLSLIPEHLVLYGPDGFGDGHLLGDWVGNKPENFLANGYGGQTFDTWCYRKRDFKKRLPGDVVLPTYSIYLREEETMDVVGRVAAQERTFRYWLQTQDPDYIQDPYAGTGMRFMKCGTPINALPGSKGCKRISIYTFES